LFEFTPQAESAPQTQRSLVVSIGVHGLAIVLLFAIRFSGSISSFPIAPPRFTLLAPVKETPIRVPRVRAPRPREFRLPPPAVAHLELPPVPLVSAPAIEIPKPTLPEIPHAAALAVANIPVIKPSGFTETKAVAPAAAPKPIIRTAGFASSDASATGTARGTLSAVGAFESPHAAEGAPVHRASTQAGGFSDSSTAASGAVHRGAVTTSITTAAFGDTTIEKGSSAPRLTATAARATPVEILSKPKPAYTAEARAKKIEGEVLLDVLFKAAGDVHVVKVARGLGAGLDETAVAAAQGIRFRPATREGEPVDSSALVHIVFQLAN
jgi:TonB family protein